MTLVSSSANGAIQGAYVPQRRAYELELADDTAGPVEIQLEASPESPIHHPAFVLKNWGEGGVAVSVNGRMMPPGKDLRVGHLTRLEGTDLVLFLFLNATAPVTIALAKWRRFSKRNA